MKTKQGKLSISLIIFLAIAVAILPFFSVLISVPQVLADGEDWLTGWGYRKSVVIDNGAGPSANYTVSLIIDSNGASGDIDLEGNCVDFPNDVTFTDDDKVTELNYWIEDLDNDPITVWVTILDDMSVSNATIYVYYGNADVVTASNIYDTFPEFGDDFSEDKISPYYTSPLFFRNLIVFYKTGDTIYCSEGGPDARLFKYNISTQTKTVITERLVGLYIVYWGSYYDSTDNVLWLAGQYMVDDDPVDVDPVLVKWELDDDTITEVVNSGSSTEFISIIKYGTDLYIGATSDSGYGMNGVWRVPIATWTDTGDWEEIWEYNEAEWGSPIKFAILDSDLFVLIGNKGEIHKYNSGTDTFDLHHTFDCPLFSPAMDWMRRVWGTVIDWAWKPGWDTAYIVFKDDTDYTVHCVEFDGTSYTNETDTEILFGIDGSGTMHFGLKIYMMDNETDCYIIVTTGEDFLAWDSECKVYETTWCSTDAEIVHRLWHSSMQWNFTLDTGGYLGEVAFDTERGRYVRNLAQKCLWSPGHKGYTITGGVFILTTTGTLDDYWNSLADFGQGYALVARMKHTISDSASDMDLGFKTRGYDHAGTKLATDVIRLYYYYLYAKIYKGTKKGALQENSAYDLTKDTNYHTWYIKRQQANGNPIARFKIDSIAEENIATANYVPTAEIPVMVRAYRAQSVYVDWIFAKPYVYPEPTFSSAGSEEVNPPTVETDNATNIEEISATLYGNITFSSEGNVSCRGFAWDTATHSTPNSSVSLIDSLYTTGNWTECGGYAAGAYSYNLTSLSEGELYYYRAAANNSLNMWGWGNESTFLTKPVEPNTLVVIDGTGESIDLTWVKGTGAQNTEIWGKSGSYPTTRGDGTLTYNSTGTSTTDNNPSCGETWYYRGWSFVTEGGLYQYSDTYDEDNTLCEETISVTTNEATLVEETYATMNGNITAICGSNASMRGFQYDIDSGAPYTLNWTESGNFGTGAYSHNITALDEGELYFGRACVNQSAVLSYGSEIQFLTKPDEPTGLTNTSQGEEWIALSWSTGNGSDKTMLRYKTGSYPSSISDGTQGYFDVGSTVNITSLTCNTPYYFRAWSYATEGALEQYSDSYSQVLASTTICLSAPTVTTDSSSNVEETTATLNGTVTDYGGENNDEQGFYYDIDSGSPYAYNQTSLGSFGNGAFDENITGLSEGELYYFQAISHNSKGWGNGSELTFLTKPDEPTGLTNTSHTSTSIGLSWTSGNGSDYYIVRYDTAGYPADHDSGTLTCNTSALNCTATPLTSGQIHYIRVWSWCTEGGLSQWSDTYDEMTEYTSPADITSFDAYNPSVSTIDLSWIKGTGGDKTLIRGKQGSYPTGITDGTLIYFDTGITTTHTGLGEDETWYYRAWAYDSNSGYYSESPDQDFEITSSAGAPTVATSAATLVEETTATLNGEVTLINDTIITDRGFQYDIDSAPPYTWNWTENGSFGLATFSYGLTNLSYGELYYFRALAENDNSIVGYGSELKFLTKPDAPSGLASTNTTDYTISLAWTTGNGSQKTMIRYATSGYPDDYDAGTQGYFGTGNTCVISSLDPGYTYYIRAWSYATEGGLTQYSDSYSQTTAITTGSSGGGIDLDVRRNLKMLGLVLLPIGLMAIGFWQKQQWIMMMAGISFIGLGAYGLIDADGTWGSSMIIGAASILFAVAVLIYATMRMREKPEPDVDVPLDEDELERQVRRNEWEERDRKRQERRNRNEGL